MFEQGDVDASSMEGDKPLLLHRVESVTDVQTSVAYFDGQLLHEDVKGLRTCRIDSMVGDEAGDAFFEGAW